MARLIWSAVGERFYEAGVDRGVLYVDEVGFPWSGLVSVDENPTGGDANPYYLDGVKYLNLSKREEYQATLSALFSPPEFDACDGVGTVHPGFFAGQQRRKSFGLCYRSKIGNDVNGVDHGYKIHIVYNALAAPTQRRNSTMSSSVQPAALSWKITTKSVLVPGMMRSSHLVIDTREASPYVVSLLEDILYGDDLNAPRLPDPVEIASLFVEGSSFTVTDLGFGIYEIEGSDLTVQMISPDIYQITADTVVAIDEDSYEISSA